ncbi:prevent-host-death family protein [Arthrobacter sp. SORGH_AS 212]|uniref:type II toxin-antitoxin system prevent-host-death family antitoxin n=1 Tax=Pseudarthrobacter sp. SORGH_AS 212 TaxID=3041777 RepID=UPI0027862292|nr:prevent-host-death family protein [Arthrobacter sp. SORGH_AS_0212]
MRTDTKNLVSVSDFSRHPSRYINSAAKGTSHVILKDNRPTAAVIDMESAERLAHLDELEDDLKLMAASLVRLVTDDGTRHSLDDVAAEFGIDLDELRKD